MLQSMLLVVLWGGSEFASGPSHSGAHEKGDKPWYEISGRRLGETIAGDYGASRDFVHNQAIMRLLRMGFPKTVLVRPMTRKLTFSMLWAQETNLVPTQTFPEDRMALESYKVPELLTQALSQHLLDLSPFATPWASGIAP